MKIDDEDVTFEELIAFRQRPVGAVILGVINIAMITGMLLLVI